MQEIITKPTWRQRWHEIIFEADTKAGQLFDVLLIINICLSVAVTMLSSVQSINAKYAMVLTGLELFFTIIFTAEYLARIICLKKPKHYIFSGLGIIDLMSIVPTYLEIFITGSKYLSVIRVLRVLRIFRILNMGKYSKQLDLLKKSLVESRRKISVFVMMVSTLVITLGSLMFLVEGPENGFTSIPQSIYWAIVTLTTVGYGDISPQTPVGQIISSLVMLIGYAIIAVPTGMVAVDIYKGLNTNTQSCPTCGADAHDLDANFCKYCGSVIN
ncbi:MAG: ion transporter [Lentisphaeria bacterium]|nr:ion transporter [Lentisphaeria bacterium]